MVRDARTHGRLHHVARVPYWLSVARQRGQVVTMLATRKVVCILCLGCCLEFDWEPMAGANVLHVTNGAVQCPHCGEMKGVGDFTWSDDQPPWFHTHPNTHWSRRAESAYPVDIVADETPSPRTPGVITSVSIAVAKLVGRQVAKAAKDRFVKLVVSMALGYGVGQHMTQAELNDLFLRTQIEIVKRDPELKPLLDELLKAVRPPTRRPFPVASIDPRRIFATTPRAVRVRLMGRPRVLRFANIQAAEQMQTGAFVTDDEMHNWIGWLGHKACEISEWSSRDNYRQALLRERVTGQVIGSVEEAPFPSELADSYWL